MTRTLLAVHAHPDDESITMGGTLARYSAAECRTVLVTATLGEEGEIIPAELAGLAASEADQLGGYRLTELRAACAALGLTEQRMLGGVGAFRDSGMVGTPSAAHRRAFHRARRGGPGHARAVDLLATILREVRPEVVATYDADGGYGHPDHLAAHEITLAATDLVGVPRVVAVVAPARETGMALAALPVPAGFRAAAPDDLGFWVDDDVVDFRIEVTAHHDARLAALAAHATQLAVLPGGFALSNRFAQPLLPAESFRLLRGDRPAGDRPADDLFTGLT